MGKIMWPSTPYSRKTLKNVSRGTRPGRMDLGGRQNKCRHLVSVSVQKMSFLNFIKTLAQDILTGCRELSMLRGIWNPHQNLFQFLVWVG